MDVGTVSIEWTRVGATSSRRSIVVIVGAEAAAGFANGTLPRLNRGIMAAVRIATRAAVAPAVMGHFFLAGLVISTALARKEGRRVSRKSVILAPARAPFRRGRRTEARRSRAQTA